MPYLQGFGQIANTVQSMLAEKQRQKENAQRLRQIQEQAAKSRQMQERMAGLQFNYQQALEQMRQQGQTGRALMGEQGAGYRAGLTEAGRMARHGQMTPYQMGQLGLAGQPKPGEVSLRQAQEDYYRAGAEERRREEPEKYKPTYEQAMKRYNEGNATAEDFAIIKARRQAFPAEKPPGWSEERWSTENEAFEWALQRIAEGAFPGLDDALQQAAKQIIESEGTAAQKRTAWKQYLTASGKTTPYMPWTGI